MRSEEGEMRLCIYLQSTDQFKGRPLYHTIVEKAKELEITRISVTQGLVGYGANGKLHSIRKWCLKNEVSVVIEVIDKETRLHRLLSCLDDMMLDGLVTIEMIGDTYVQKKSLSKMPITNSFYERLKKLFKYFKPRIYVVYIPGSY